jgi:probable selenium-dependent hydroxylase accessory protein YqeC
MTRQQATNALAEALGLRAGMCVAVVGAGGKTTLCWRLTQALAAAGERVIFTTTTRIWQPAEGTFDRLCIGPPDDILRRLCAATDWRTACLAQDIQGQPDAAPIREAAMPCVRTKLLGFPTEAIANLKAVLKATWLVEADGARGLLVKAPGLHEPAIPPCADLVCVLASLDAVGRPLDDQTVHRAARATQLTGARLAHPITPTMLINLLVHPEGGLKGIPAAAHRVAVLTQRAADACPVWAGALMAALHRSGFERVVLLSPRAAHPLLGAR